MIKCKEAVARLWSYLDRNLDRVEEQELEAHLGLCRHCCGELEFARQIRGLLRRTAGAVEIPPAARAKLDTFLRELEGSHE
ncbi:MAG: zf-HC2 domain-containing protein [Armatimonadota bacterium]|nr:zf-HC2 domain-containing protein [Armatimonadota bacterium]MDR7464162.1 zf-HC2 domain-containing protein [Armatimonadota bacterium]MDR7470369.1 zf-HC2 domain-containing protein [Armatimonadota bacterium]MDR7474084.1 zf-HC2 domain-containing protein [Armatimonadota bacterium]MDR7539141.1 zf-HC2 domain-containing protein [Armatimonadota bacterium]